MRPRKGLGQNFLISPPIAERIVKAANLGLDDVVLEVGPGRGILTFLIFPQVKKLIAVEKDKNLFQELKEKIDVKNVILENKDILEYDFKKFRKIKIIANLPYYISSPFLFKMLENFKKIEAVVLMLQKEFASRLIASPHTKEYGTLSIFYQNMAEIKKLFIVKRGNFWPRPRVDSMVIFIKFRPRPLYPVYHQALFARIVRLSFGQRRKILLNSLNSLIELVGGRENYKKVFASAEIDFNRRGESLSIEEFSRLIKEFYHARTARGGDLLS